MTVRLPGLSAAIARRTRLAMAFAQSGPGNDKQRGRALEAWLGALPVPGIREREDPCELEASVNATLGRFTALAEGATEQLLEPTVALMRAGSAAASELSKLSAFGKAVEPDVLGAWIELSADGLDGGWVMTDEIAVDDALELAGGGDAAGGLRAWAEAARMPVCTRVRRSVGAGNPFTELVLPIQSRAHSLADDAFGALAAERLPPAIVALLAEGPAPTGLSVFLSATGVSRVGILIPGPDTRTVLALRDAVSASKTTETALAALEGHLDADGPDHITIVRTSEGLDLELAYSLGPEKAAKPPSD